MPSRRSTTLTNEEGTLEKRASPKSGWKFASAEASADSGFDAARTAVCDATTTSERHGCRSGGIAIRLRLARSC